MRRITISFTALAIAAVLLLSFRGPEDAAVVIATGGPGRIASSSAGVAGPFGSSPLPAGSSPSSGRGAGSGSGAGAGGSAGAFTGSRISTRYGPVQVSITVQGGTITDVEAVALPSGGHSGRISNAVAPLLRSEALAVQSAAIDIVSGATYTSLAYAQSLQAALDAAGG